MSKNKKSNDTGVVDSNKESFFEKMKSDKKYNAKVQLTLYGVFIVILVIYLNIASIGSNGSGLPSNTVLGNISDNGKENASQEDTNLLKNLGNNYSYDALINISKRSVNIESNEEVIVEHSIKYHGKSYDNKLEVNKVIDENTNLYYKVDNSYYSMVNNITSSVREEVIYDIIDSNYIELDGIMDLISKSSLDHVTDYSSGKKVFVYHYKVLSEVSSYQDNGVVEINIEEENEVLKINIDYSNLFKVIDKSIDGCKLELIVTDINKVEDFEVVVSADNKDNTGDNNNEENTSLE